MGKLNPMLAITLAASLAALGCTTNHTLGNGTPTRSGPEVRTAPTSGVTSGGETETPPVNPPMTSSYNRSEILPIVKPRLIRRSADEAAAIMAGSQPLRGRYLGVVSPGSAAARSGYQSDGIQNFVNPALITNPQLTVNSSISSQPNEVITTGAEGAVATGGTTAAATIAGTATLTPAPTPTTAATSLLPTFASAGNPTVTAASGGLGRTTAQAATSTTTTTTATAPATVTTAVGTRAGAITSPVRIIRNTGTVTVTNVGTTGRNQ
jgi:hypothetical protein